MPDVKCPNGHTLNVPDAYLGQEVRCSVCSVTFVAPATAPDPEAAPATPTANASHEEVAAPLSAGRGSIVEQDRTRAAGIGILSWLDSERLGKPLLFAGLVLVILFRGCDGLGARWANRISEKASSGPRRFDQKTARLLRDAKEADKVELRTDRQEDRKKLEDSWSDLTDKASNARSNHVMWAFFYHLGFVFGSLALAIGLLVVGFNGTGSERMICLIIIAIMSFSIYIGGAPWLEGMFSTIRP